MDQFKGMEKQSKKNPLSISQIKHGSGQLEAKGRLQQLATWQIVNVHKFKPKVLHHLLVPLL